MNTDFMTYLEKNGKISINEMYEDEMVKQVASRTDTQMYGLLKKYFEKGGDARTSLHGFGVDLYEALDKFLHSEFAETAGKPSPFANDKDAKIKFNKAIRDQFTEKLGIKVIDTLTTIGETVDRIRGSIPLKYTAASLDVSDDDDLDVEDFKG